SNKAITPTERPGFFAFRLREKKPQNCAKSALNFPGWQKLNRYGGTLYPLLPPFFFLTISALTAIR
ncbi:hypothetical protein, partial [Erwinia persicina]|uniref:hypothetical protein n=1 Tax=Erwinia persicina TaxID=55211 RepID=UPI001A7E56C8